MSWHPKRDGLLLRWGNACYLARCFEEIYILTEIYLTGDYDVMPVSPSVVVDVGANVGFSAIFLANENADMIVEGYEPVPLNHRQACVNLELNPQIANRISFFNLGLFSSEGIQTITSEVNNRGMSSVVLDRRLTRGGTVEEIEVKMRLASDVVRDVRARYPLRHLVVKMDCEGSEYEIFDELAASGALALIDLFVMEWHRLSASNAEIEHLRNLLVSNGFHVYSRGRLQSKVSVGMAVACRMPQIKDSGQAAR